MTKKKTVLVVDDDDEVRELFSSFIEGLGYNVELKENATSAQNWLSSNRPDLILLDIMLPDMTGIELCKWINSQEHIKKTPIIHLTAALTDEIAQEDSMLAGARDFMTKPPDFELLEKKIRMFLNDEKE